MDGYVSLKDVVNIITLMSDDNLGGMSTDFPKTPENKIEFGMVTRQTEKEYIQWIIDVLNTTATNKEKAEVLYEALVQLGFEEGSYKKVC